MANNLPPVLFPVSAIKDYLKGILFYYEQGDPILNRSFMLQAYKLAYGDCDPEALKNGAWPRG